MTDIELQEQIRTQARELLQSGQIHCFIGYEQGSRARVRPAFIRDVEVVDRLIWNQGCTHNLVTYLRDFDLTAGCDTPTQRLAVLVKPCDSRALNVLISERQIERDRLYIVGVACEGIVQEDGQRSDTLQTRCLRCSDRLPVVYDKLIGEPASVEKQTDIDEFNEAEARSSAEKTAFWLNQFERCILCYACRQVCPGCYCNVCMFERDDCLWVSPAVEVKDKELFHLGRAYHLAARCVDCDECERVCPMELPLSLLNRKLGKEVQALFHYRAGDEATQSPLATPLAEGEDPPL